MIEFVDIEIPPQSEEQLKAIKLVRDHWKVIDDNGSIQWFPCGPDCTHEPT